VAVSPGWRRTIDLKQFLSDDDSDENARKVAGRIATVLRRQPEYDEVNFSSLAMVVQDLETVENARELNETLDEVYDWADGERIWIGGTRGAAA
jgi:hypothetical protein